MKVGTQWSREGFFPVRLRIFVSNDLQSRLNYMESAHHERKDLGSMAGSVV